MTSNGELFEIPSSHKVLSMMPEYCTLEILASLLDLSKKRVSNLKSDGVFEATDKDRYFLAGSTKAYIKFLKTGSRNKKAELDQAKLDRILRENKEAEKELINLDFAGQIYMELGSIIVNHLESFASRIASDVAVLSDVAEVQAFLYEECRSVREDIKRTVEDSDFFKE